MAAPMEATRYTGVFKRGSRYVAVWRAGGRQHKRSARTLEAARKLRAAMQADVARDEFDPQSRVTFAEYAAEWIERYIELPNATAPITAGQLSVGPARDAPAPAPLAVYAGDDRVATIASQDHADVATILDTGLAISFTLNTATDPVAVTVTLPLGDTE